MVGKLSHPPGKDTATVESAHWALHNMAFGLGRIFSSALT